jgi:hypothetical protein
LAKFTEIPIRKTVWSLKIINFPSGRSQRERESEKKLFRDEVQSDFIEASSNNLNNVRVYLLHNSNQIQILFKWKTCERVKWKVSYFCEKSIFLLAQRILSSCEIQEKGNANASNLFVTFLWRYIKEYYRGFSYPRIT